MQTSVYTRTESEVCLEMMSGVHEQAQAAGGGGGLIDLRHDLTRGTAGARAGAGAG